MADKKISELDLVSQINNDAVIPLSQDNSGTATTYKTTITGLATEIAEDQTFSNLQTTSKKLVGAINEVAQGGGGGGGSSNANIAPDYDSTSTYAVGDWCIYNGTLYQCTTAITVAEAFDPTHWTAKKVVDAFDDINTALSGKVNTSNFYGTSLPMSTTEPTSMVADRITALEYNSGDQMGFAFQQLLCRIDSNGKRLSIFIPLSKIVKASTVTASGDYSIYDINANSLLSTHSIANDTQGITIVNNGVVLTITLTTALSVTLGYGVVELRNTFKLTFT